ncbi:hypothetical protein IEQ34_022654 [Dendrobium chrysotoxum]|uniref:Methyltransferase small domain-containing protein n=1 Tax=Dendrobium chrysotoxum TaxID=161865 RepID=A0AAV7FYC7_DENCH|nr:hypothetical protein IEQ34_022654 [Dendrobium chrysotoxum]
MTLFLRPPLLVTARLALSHPPYRPQKVEAKGVLASSCPSVAHQKPSFNLESVSSSSFTAATSLQCLHFQSCSGCSQEWDLDQPRVVTEARKFFQELGISDLKFESGMLVEWRCRAKLAVRGTSERPLIGLYEEGTHNVVDIPLCRAHHPNINVAVNLLKQGICALNIQPYDEDLGTGELRYVQIAVTTYNTSLPAAERYQNGKVQVSLVWNSRNEQSESYKKLNALAEFLWRNAGPRSNSHLFHSIWVNFQTSSSNIIFGNRWRLLLGERDFWEHIGGIDVCLDPSSFGQANTQAFNSLLRKLQKYVPYGSSVVDLYAGAGVIGLSVAATRKCRQGRRLLSLRCVEINKESKLSFEKSLSRFPKHIDCNVHWHNTDASIEPLHWLKGSNVVIVDPPRKGVEQSLLDALREISKCKDSKVPKSSIINEKEEKRPWILRARKATVHVESKTSINWAKDQIWPEFIIYVSCGWESFKEDCLSPLKLPTELSVFAVQQCLAFGKGSCFQFLSWDRESRYRKEGNVRRRFGVESQGMGIVATAATDRICTEL